MKGWQMAWMYLLLNFVGFSLVYGAESKLESISARKYTCRRSLGLSVIADTQEWLKPTITWDPTEGWVRITGAGEDSFDKASHDFLGRVSQNEKTQDFSFSSPHGYSLLNPNFKFQNHYWGSFDDEQQQVRAIVAETTVNSQGSLQSVFKYRCELKD